MTVWKLIPHHEDHHRGLRWMRGESKIALGWGHCGDLRELAPSDKEKIREAVQAAYPDLTNDINAGIDLWNLYSEVRVGDLVVLIQDSKRVDVIEVTGGYEHIPESEAVDDYQHVRGVAFLKKNPDVVYLEAGGYADRGTLRRVRPR